MPSLRQMNFSCHHLDGHDGFKDKKFPYWKAPSRFINIGEI